VSARAREAEQIACTPEDVVAIARKLRSTRESLRSRTTRELAAALGAAGRRFLDPSDPVRAEALARLPASSGLSSAVCEGLLDGMAADWTDERLLELMALELGDPSALDVPLERAAGSSLAIGPALCFQVAAGGVPGIGVTALLRSLMVKAPTLLKAGRGDQLLPSLFAGGLAELDGALAESLAVLYWPGDSEAHLRAALSGADVVVAYGSDESVAATRALTPVTTRFVSYHHRISVGVVGREALSREIVDVVAAEVAAAVSAYDQRGCVSPQIVYVEEGGALSPSEFAARLVSALGDAEARWPSAKLAPGDASRLQQARGTAELLAHSDVGSSVHHGGAAAWTVTFEPRDLPAMPVAGRFVRVRPIGDAAELPRALGPLAAHLQTVGVAGLDERLLDLTKALGETGASRVAPFRAVPFPPPWWHHDGRGPLLDLVRWVDLERPTGTAEVTPPASAARPSR
jgi:hypothetical protein